MRERGALEGVLGIAMGIVRIAMHCFHWKFNIGNIANVGNALRKEDKFK